MENTKLLETIVGHLVDLRQDMSGMKQDITDMKQRMDSLDKRMDSLDQRMGGLDQRMDGLDQRMDGLEENQHNLQAAVARIEVEHGNKLSALLDGYHHNAEALERVEIRLERVEAKIESHDIQISVLDRTKTNRRKAK